MIAAAVTSLSRRLDKLEVPIRISRDASIDRGTVWHVQSAMPMRMLLSIALLSRVASAEPALSGLEVAARGGGELVQHAEYRDPAHATIAPTVFVEIEAGWRVRPQVSVAVFAAHARVDDPSGNDFENFPSGTINDTNTHDLVDDLGARAYYHHGTVLLGAGVGVERFTSRQLAMTAPQPPMTVSDSSSGLLIDTSATYRFPRIDACACAFELTAGLAYAGNVSGGTTGAARLALGVASW